VLENIDLTIQPGERIALVGENGAGKSTFAKLLLGLYAPTHGGITIDEVDLSTIPPHEWRARTTAVFQDSVKYALTVRENIGLGNCRYCTTMMRFRERRRKAEQIFWRRPCLLRTIRCWAKSMTNKARTFPSANGRSWRSPGLICEKRRFSFWMNRPLPWMQEPKWMSIDSSVNYQQGNQSS